MTSFFKPLASKRPFKCLALAFFALCLIALQGCSSPSVLSYKNEKPSLNLKEFFNGEVKAWGIFTNRSGEVIKRFTVVMNCTWNGDEGILDENFTYSDGTKQQRIWRLKDIGDGSYQGSASDVIGLAQGQSSGNALQWKYILSLPVDDKHWEVQFEDWMYQIDDKVMLNKARMSKWGIYLGEVTLSFTKAPLTEKVSAQ
jgi:hypothetical protein